MEGLRIVLLCVAGAILYGIVHDNVTARICVEYFSVGHPPVFGHTSNPTLLAFGWGVLATWWVGALLGVPAALLARLGARPKLAWRDLRRPILVLFVVVGASAVVAWPLGWFGATMATGLDPNRLPGVPPERIARYMGNAAAHSAAYAVGFVGGVLMWGWIWWRRGRAERRLLLAELERLRTENRMLLERLKGS